MPRLQPPAIARLLFVCMCWFGQISSAQTGKLVVQVEDLQNRPVRGVAVGIGGIGGSGVTGDDGKVVLALGNSPKEGERVSLLILHSPPGNDWVILSPWERDITLPSFAKKAYYSITVFIVQRGDRSALENGTVIASLIKQINKESTPKSAVRSQASEDPKAALNAVAKEYGLPPDDLDQRIRAWGVAKTTDPYERGLAALYERNFPEASSQLQAAVRAREIKLNADQETVEADRKALSDAAFFLGSSSFQQGRYKEAADAFRKRLRFTPDDSTVLADLGLSLQLAGDYASAEPPTRRALALIEDALTQDAPNVVRNLNYYAKSLETMADNTDLEKSLRFTLSINLQSAFMPQPPAPDGGFHFWVGIFGEAAVLTNLSELLLAKKDSASAEPILYRALVFNERAYGSDSVQAVRCLNNLGRLFLDKGKYAPAERLLRSALAITERLSGPESADVALLLNNLAEVLTAKGDPAGAEPLYRRALAIDQKVLGPEHSMTKIIQRNLDISLKAVPGKDK